MINDAVFNHLELVCGRKIKDFGTLHQEIHRMLKKVLMGHYYGDWVDQNAKVNVDIWLMRFQRTVPTPQES